MLLQTCVFTIQLFITQKFGTIKCEFKYASEINKSFVHIYILHFEFFNSGILKTANVCSFNSPAFWFEDILNIFYL